MTARKKSVRNSALSNQGRSGPSGQGSVRFGWAGPARHGAVGSGPVWSGLAW
jgi:hypothetical protein